MAYEYLASICHHILTNVLSIEGVIERKKKKVTVLEADE
jgi:hypothetical protein